MDAKPMNKDSGMAGVLLEGNIAFDNGKLSTSYSDYWTQIVRLTDKKTGAERVVFRVQRDKKNPLKGHAGHLGDDLVKRQVVIWSSLGNADPQLPRKIHIVSH